jgi:protein-tyrosine-phosphatase
MAEALTRLLTSGQVEVYSAGSHPAAQIHPEAVRALARLGADMSQHIPKSLDQFQGQSFDRVVLLHARDEEEELSFQGTSKVVPWDFADPVKKSGTAEEQTRAFQALGAELMMRIRLLLALIERERREQRTSRPPIT